jgi:uncharacterized membrane protein (DUF485 family)
LLLPSVVLLPIFLELSLSLPLLAALSSFMLPATPCRTVLLAWLIAVWLLAMSFCLLTVPL